MPHSARAPRAADLPTPRGVHRAFLLIALAAVLVAVAVALWGPAALTIAMLPLVAVIFILFVWIGLP